MLAEFVKAIAELTKAEAGFDSFVSADETQYIRLPGGEITHCEPLPTLRTFETSDLETFIAIVEQGADPIVCISESKMVGYFDQNDRREYVAFGLSASSALVALEKLDNWTGQRDAVGMLRDDLFDCCEPGLLPAMRRLDFSRRSDGSRTIEHGRESLGRSVEATIQSKGGELAEVYLFDLPIFREDPFCGFRVKVNVAFEADASAERIRFVVRGDELTHARDRALRNARKIVVDALSSQSLDVPVYVASHTGVRR